MRGAKAAPRTWRVASFSSCMSERREARRCRSPFILLAVDKLGAGMVGLGTELAGLSRKIVSEWPMSSAVDWSRAMLRSCSAASCLRRHTYCQMLRSSCTRSGFIK